MQDGPNARRILIVDDDASIRTTLQAALEAEDRVVETAGDGPEGLARIREEAFDLVLLDLKMPEMSGEEVLREALSDQPALPIVIITAHGDVETAVEALQEGAVHFIQKPFSVEDARTLARTMLDESVPAPDAGDPTPPAAPASDEDGYEANLNRARDAVEQRDLEAAVRHARAALAFAPTRPDAFNVMGVAAQLQMNVNEAQKYYRAALSLDPTYDPAQNNLDNTSSVPQRLSAFDLG